MKRTGHLTSLAAFLAVGTAAAAYGDIGFAGAQAAALNIAPTNVPMEISVRTVGGTLRYEVDMLLPSGNSMREVVLRASNGQLIENEVESLGASDRAFYASVVNLLAGGTVGLPAGGSIAASGWPGWTLSDVEYDIEGGQLVIESRLRQGTQTVWVSVDADTGTLLDLPDGGNGGDPVDAIGAIGVAENARPGWVAIEIESTTDSGPAWEVVMLDPNTSNVREIEIDADSGAVLADVPLTLSGGELADVQFIASLLPLPITLTEGVDLVLAQTGPGDIRFVEFDRENGNLVLIGRVATANGVVNVTIDPFQTGNCPADLNNDNVVDFFDLTTFLGLFDAGNPAADLNSDANFDFFDVVAYLSLFDAGCP